MAYGLNPTIVKCKSMKSFISISLVLIFLSLTGFSQCTPLGDQTTYGTNNTWIGYVYRGANFNVYSGYVNEGSSSNPNFDESFGGAQVNYATNGCTIYTDTFSVRYKLTKTFSDADYVFTVGGDDGYRFSLDGGATWVVNQWSDHSYGTTNYTVHLSGTYNMVFEYYEKYIDNRASFSVAASCTGSGDPTVYGTNSKWIGYVYSGMSFNSYKGYVYEGTSVNPNFDESFGGDNVTYNTSDCSITTEQFSVRYRLKENLASGVYQITVGGDDGYRLSLDGGSTWVINKWNDQSYNTTTYSASLAGSYNMVLEYYENGGQNRISFGLSGGAILPLTLSQFNVQSQPAHTNLLEWKTMMEMKVDHYIVQRSDDGIHFQNLGIVHSKMTDSTHDYQLDYTYIDASPLPGTTYYRLQIVDESGNSNFSDIIRAINAQANGLKIYPTVVQNTNLFVETDKPIRNARLEIFDLSGKKLSETSWETLSGRQSLQPANNMSAIATGTYLARLSSQGQTLLNQLLIIQSH